MSSRRISPHTRRTAAILALLLLWAGLAQGLETLPVTGILYRSGKDYFLETELGDVYALEGEDLDLYQENLVVVTGVVRQRDGDMPLIEAASVRLLEEDQNIPDAEAEPEEPGGPETL